MRRAGHQTLGLSCTSQDNQSNEIRPQAPYSLEAIIALQSALQNGIPESEQEQTEADDGAELRDRQITDTVDSFLGQRRLKLLLTKIEQFASGAVQRFRRSRVRKSTAGQR